jgi:hypothetical protein
MQASRSSSRAAPLPPHTLPTLGALSLQLPLPAHVNENNVLDAISFEKDADGLHPLNAGFLSLKGRKPLAVACTPKVRRRPASAGGCRSAQALSAGVC